MPVFHQVWPPRVAQHAEPAAHGIRRQHSAKELVRTDSAPRHMQPVRLEDLLKVAIPG
jgi:hypothetical protein